MYIKIGKLKGIIDDVNDLKKLFKESSDVLSKLEKIDDDENIVLVAAETAVFAQENSEDSAL